MKAAEERAIADKAAAVAAREGHAAELQAAQKANTAHMAKLAAKQEAEQAKAAKAAEDAHQSAIAARKAQAERQAAEHEAALQKRTEDMSSQYKHVWFSGETGITFAQLTMYGRVPADDLIQKLYHENIIADSWYIKSDTLSQTYIDDGQMTTTEGERKLIMITTDGRLNELKSYVHKIMGANDQAKASDQDLIFFKPKTGNKDYF